ncbi:MAG: hypothetical protein Q9222_005320 [Ikaeria aurantiellina]
MKFGKLMYQTDIGLCLLEGMSGLFDLAVIKKEDALLTQDKFFKRYGQASVTVASYSPPAFRIKAGGTVNALRGIGLFMSLYGYFETDFDVYSRRLGHIGAGSVAS